MTCNIEDISLGQRLVGTNPLREQTQPASEIDPATWPAVRLKMTQGGAEYDLAFLRPVSWIEATGAQVACACGVMTVAASLGLQRHSWLGIQAARFVSFVDSSLVTPCLMTSQM